MVDLKGHIDKVIFHLEALLKTGGSLLRPLQDEVTMPILSSTGRENVLKFRVPQHVTNCKMIRYWKHDIIRDFNSFRLSTLLCR